MSAETKQKLIKMAAHGMYRSGALRAAQAFSDHFELRNSENGQPAAFRRVRHSKFLVLCYHRVGSGGVPFYSNLDPAIFEEQIRFLRRSYRIVSLDDVCRKLDAGGPPEQAVAITFDDGYRDLYNFAFPILRRYGVPATIYLTAAAIETGEISWYDRIFVLAMSPQLDVLELDARRWPLSSPESRLQAATEIVQTLRQYPNNARKAACEDLERRSALSAQVLRVKDRMLTWTQVREMQSGGVSFGAHTMNHPVVSRLAPHEFDMELGDSRRLLENRLQAPVEHFAFPFGSLSDIDAESCAQMPRFGYRSAATTIWGVNTPETSPHLLHRIGGDEPSIAVLALRLRWMFLKEQTVSEKLQDLRRAFESRVAPPAKLAQAGGTQPEVPRA